MWPFSSKKDENTASEDVSGLRELLTAFLKNKSTAEFGFLKGAPDFVDLVTGIINGLEGSEKRMNDANKNIAEFRLWQNNNPGVPIEHWEKILLLRQQYKDVLEKDTSFQGCTAQFKSLQSTLPQGRLKLLIKALVGVAEERTANHKKWVEDNKLLFVVRKNAKQEQTRGKIAA